MLISGSIILHRAEGLRALLAEHAGITGPTLEDQIHAARRVLPRPVLDAARRIAAAAAEVRQRGMHSTMDVHGFDEDYRLCLRHLHHITPKDTDLPRFRATLQGALTGTLAAITLFLGIASWMAVH